MGAVRFASMVVTYRCNARCRMCHTWKHPTSKEEELGPGAYENLPFMKTINVTGGEPFIREDLDELIAVLKKKTERLVISTNGFFTERIMRFFQRHGDVGIRVSIEGLSRSNDELRGLKDGFDRGMRTLAGLHRLGVKDIGFGMTISDENRGDVVDLYSLSKMMDVEFATAAVHNSFYFHKFDNRFEAPEAVSEALGELVAEMLASKRIKDWFRAYFNYGLINYVRGRRRLLPCEMGKDSFFVDPHGEVFPCNVLEESMGNIKERPFAEIWSGLEAERVRGVSSNCGKNCWMMGSVGQQMKKYPWRPALWVLRRKIFGGKPL